jgi:hypothetical protein
LQGGTEGKGKWAVESGRGLLVGGKEGKLEWIRRREEEEEEEYQARQNKEALP